MAQTLSKGDIAYIEYDLWLSQPDGSWKLRETTSEELAKKEGVHEEKRVYTAIPVIVGADRLMKGFEEALHGTEVGSEKEVTMKADKGAGERDAKLVQLHSLREFLKNEIDPHVGMEVNLSGRRGYVTAVTAGRVRVDYNNPLAGRSLKYHYKVLRIASTPEERVKAILDLDYGLEESFGIALENEEADIRLPGVCKTDEKWFISKFRVVADLRQHAGIKKVRLVEEYEEKGLEAEKPGASATVETTSHVHGEKEAPAEKAETPAEAPAAPATEDVKPRRRKAKAEKAPEEL